MLTRPRALIAVALLMVLAAWQVRTQSQTATTVTSPREELGANIGDDYFLATYSQLEKYWKKLDRQSERMSLIDIGRTEEGRTQWMAVISSPENIKGLDRYRGISQRLAQAEGLTDEQARSMARDG